MPCACRNSSSSPPRPNTNGSPPFRRTTRRPARACSSISAWICSCRVLWPWADLPTSMQRAARCARRRICGLTRRSYRITSACRSARTALRVSRPGSPGPAPTSATLPGVRVRRLAGGGGSLAMGGNAAAAGAASWVSSRCAPAALRKAAFTADTSLAAMVSQTGWSGSASHCGSKLPTSQRTCPDCAQPRNAGVSSGAPTSGTAPACSRLAVARSAARPPPTTRTARPRRSARSGNRAVTDRGFEGRARP